MHCGPMRMSQLVVPDFQCDLARCVANAAAGHTRRKMRCALMRPFCECCGRPYSEYDAVCPDAVFENAADSHTRRMMRCSMIWSFSNAVAGHTRRMMPCGPMRCFSECCGRTYSTCDELLSDVFFASATAGRSWLSTQCGLMRSFCTLLG